MTARRFVAFYPPDPERIHPVVVAQTCLDNAVREWYWRLVQGPRPSRTLRMIRRPPLLPLLSHDRSFRAHAARRTNLYRGQGIVRVRSGGRTHTKANLYRTEYAKQLGGWPQAILVSSSPISGKPRRTDHVVIVGCSEWISAELVEGCWAIS
jgi:hypothetical protein